MKLYCVVRTFYILANDEVEAESYRPDDALSCTNEVFEATSVDSEWWDLLPFTTDSNTGDKTCGELIRDK